MKLVHAYCFQTGVIEFGTEVPAGAIVVAASYMEKRLKNFIEVNARHSYDGKTLLVPGVPEQANEYRKVNALGDWLDLLEGKACDLIDVGFIKQRFTEQECLQLDDSTDGAA